MLLASHFHQVVNWSYILKYLLSTMSTLKQQIKVERSKYTDDALPTYQKSSTRAAASNIENPESRQPSAASSERRELTLSGILEGTRGYHDPLMTQREDERRRSNYRPQSDPISRESSDHSGNEKRRAYSRNLLDDDHLSPGVDETSGSRSSRSSAESNQSRGSMNALPSPHFTMQSQPSLAASSSLQRVQYRMRNAVSSEMDERKRRSQAGKLGPRLATASNIVSHNAAMVSASRSETYGGPPGDDDDSNDLASTNESETNGSFRSAATVGSIPPHVSTSAKQNHSQFAKSIVSDLGVEGHQALAAMSVIDRVTNITDDQLRKLDPETREQVMSSARAYSHITLFFL
jgi:hypothetical protein